MYGLVPYNISPIQQAIQYGHAVVEYAQLYFYDYEYQTWASHDKTFIILNGGTTNWNLDSLGTLNSHRISLEENGIKLATFNEPDLGDQLTAVVFLVDDRVWDKKNWPDYVMNHENASLTLEKVRNGEDSRLIRESFQDWQDWKSKFSEDHEEAMMIVWLRDFLTNFKLA
jgi:hypothetical protein